MLLTDKTAFNPSTLEMEARGPQWVQVPSQPVLHSELQGRQKLHWETCLKKGREGAGEFAPQLGAPDALAEDPGMISSTHGGS